MNLELASDRLLGRHHLDNEGGGESKIFESLENAIRFVMVDLVEPYRSTASVDSNDGGHYSIEEIRDIYASEEYKSRD